ncbi:MAG TPA: helix-turn-helix transcriptional regulator, partial [Isosphaeraceae bacterium]
MTLPKEIRAVIREMVAILNDPDVDEDDRAMALATMDEALFPTHSPFDGRLGVDLADLERHATGEEAAIQETMDREEALFAARVESLLKERGMTQAQLAEAIGVG